MLASKRDMLRLDPELLKVLASDRRRSILHLLKKRRMTVTELSRSLSLGKPTVLDHLKRLQEAELIQRHEDDRLWVYYSLTETGRSFLQPSKIPIFLILSVSIVALAGVAFLVALLTSVPADGGLDAFLVGDDGARLDGYTVFPGINTGLRIDAPNGTGDAMQWTVGLVTEAPKAGVRPTLDATGPLESTPDGLHLYVNTTAPGRYFLYVEDAEGHDNRGAMPEVVVPRLDVDASHETWWRALDGDLEVGLRLDDTAAEGRIVVAGTGLEADLHSGTASFPAVALDGAAAGEHGLFYFPAGRDDRVPLGAVAVQEPTVELVPRVVKEASSVEFLLQLPDGVPTSLGVTASGSPAAVFQEGAGLFRVDTDLRAGAGSIEVGRLDPIPVTVLPDLAFRLELREGPEMWLRVTGLNGPVANATVRIDGQSLGETDVQGWLPVPLLDEGPHALAVASSGVEVARDLMAYGWNVVSVASPALSLEVGQVREDIGAASVDVTLQNPGDKDAETTVAAIVGDSLFAARHVTVPANGQVQVALSGALLSPSEVEVQAFRPGDPAFRFVNLTQTSSGSTSTGTATTTATSTATATQTTTATSTGTVGDVVPSFDTSVLGQRASPLRGILIQPVIDPSSGVGTGVADQEGESTQVPAPGIMLLVLVGVAAALWRRTRPPATP